jgi:hypothetical protein
MMNISFTHNGKQYLNFDTDAVEWETLIIPLEEKQLIIQQAKEQEVKDKRSAAYGTESDSLYLEWQYDKTPEKEQVWRDKVAEIKARYPLPTNS